MKARNFLLSTGVVIVAKKVIELNNSIALSTEPISVKVYPSLQKYMDEPVIRESGRNYSFETSNFVFTDKTHIIAHW